MSVSPGGCLSDDEISTYASGRDRGSRSRVVAHIDGCADCRILVAAAARGDRAVESTPTSDSGPRIGRYAVRRVLGEGTMGIVHLAYDPQLRRQVALKVILPGSGDALARERLMLEAQAAAQLSHPNAVAVYDVGLHEGQPYVAMEYVAGSTVGEWLRKGTSWPEAIEVLLAAGEGLSAAHRAGLVHRDFKPANILLGSNGSVKVSDFGLVRFSDETLAAIAAHEEALELPRPNRASTETGVFVGTPAYTSPEQFAGAAASALSDQFSFCVTLYQALYGVRPFRGPTLYAVYEAITRDQPPPPPRDSRVPPAFWPIVSRGLAKDPEARFPTMADLLAAIRDVSGLRGETLSSERCPFPGLVSFGEQDAAVFFGRTREVGELVGRLRDQGVAAVVGPSGAGKSSFVRALAIPRLRHDDPSCEVLTMRPGSRPLTALARLVAPLASGDGSLQGVSPQIDEIANWLRREPRRLAGMLLSHARHYNSTVVLLVDQLEELYAQVDDPAERIAFADAIASVGSDPLRPLRLVVTLRSDFLDRAAESQLLMDRITAGFSFLGSPGRSTLVEAITRPLEAVGFTLEDPEIAERLARELDGQPGAFPLLQFVAGRLWDERDRERRLITRASFDAIGALSGALAVHADAVLAQLPNESVALARAILLRLVTPERTRAAVAVRELAALASPAKLDSVIDLFVRARLLIADGATVELIHEALIAAWPTLRRWLDDQVGDATVVADVGAAARRWEAAGRPDGFLWSGDEANRAIALTERVALTSVESAFIGATLRVTRRSKRRRRLALAGIFVVLVAVAVAASVAVFVIRKAEQRASEQADVAVRAADSARAAEQVATEELAARKAAELRGDLAAQKVVASQSEIAAKNAELARKNEELVLAIEVARNERAAAIQSRADLEKAFSQLRAMTDTVKGLNATLAARNKALQEELRQLRAGMMGSVKATKPAPRGL